MDRGVTTRGRLARILAAVSTAVLSVVTFGHHHHAERASEARSLTGHTLTVRDVQTDSLVDPVRSTAPSAVFREYCLETPAGRYRGTVAQCNRAAWININRARGAEGLGRLHLPAGFARRSSQSQLTIVANAERRSRGLPAFRQAGNLDAAATVAAKEFTDPVGPSGFSWASNWAGGYRTPLASDFAWMYDDGPGGTNVGCTWAGEAGCWGHRRAILSPFAGWAGAARVIVRGMWSSTELFVAS